MPNYRIPRLAYTFYVRSVRSLKSNLQPVVFERVGKTTTCSSDPLGLAWLPTSRWKPGRTYVVRMAPIETNTSGPGTARLYVGVAGMAVPHFKACPRFSPHHTTQVGVLPFTF
jgi:hypothetical protein